jgi:ABC-type transporter Mla maintaining outer membrane lipid asymmetry ATPase subunit MlaF
VGSLGKTTILASHDPATVLPFARHVIFLERGELAFAGSVLKFRESAHPLIRQYLEASRC